MEVAVDVKSVSKFFKVSLSTIYRWIGLGKLTATKVNRRWDVKMPEEESVEWHPQVHQETAIQDGKGPEDFQFEQWEVSDIFIVPDRRCGIAIHCKVPEDTPEANRYTATGQKIPDPVGMALAHVDFTVRDLVNRSVLMRQDSVGHDEGELVAYGMSKVLLWEKLRNEGDVVDVYVTARPSFYYLNEKGGAVSYSNTGNGMFHGKTEVSSPIRLTTESNGMVRVDELPPGG